MQWIVNAYILACASFIVVGGQLGNLLGVEICFCRCRFFIISSLMIALGHHPTILVVGRASQGLAPPLSRP
ncbi:hypothetical protein [Coxiella endosymbiont of Ornithodoros amblus]|uniref:hypothetical protein n=1 Tax=Coxiella endosymbiont of Ornithodoros amblus TaxID=1656166 RepID=UPI003CC723FD